MYPVIRPPPASKANARDMVELIDELIQLREHNITNCNGEKIEVVKRAMTDYLLSTDPRPGIYVK